MFVQITSRGAACNTKRENPSEVFIYIRSKCGSGLVGGPLVPLCVCAHVFCTFSRKKVWENLSQPAPASSTARKQIILVVGKTIFLASALCVLCKEGTVELQPSLKSPFKDWKPPTTPALFTYLPCKIPCVCLLKLPRVLYIFQERRCAVYTASLKNINRSDVCTQMWRLHWKATGAPKTNRLLRSAPDNWGTGGKEQHQFITTSYHNQIKLLFRDPHFKSNNIHNRLYSKRLYNVRQVKISLFLVTFGNSFLPPSSFTFRMAFGNGTALMLKPNRR